MISDTMQSILHVIAKHLFVLSVGMVLGWIWSIVILLGAL
jgi:hypothetical protein